MNSSQSLTTQLDHEVSWTTVLEQLNVKADSVALPASSACPLCPTGHLITMADTRYKDQIWCYCRQCGFGGDIFDLYAAAGQFPTETPREKLSTAFARLADLGLIVHPEPDQLTQRIQMSERRHLGLELWNKSLQDSPDLLKTDQGLRGIVHMLGLTYQASTWAERTGKIIGVTPLNSFYRVQGWDGSPIIGHRSAHIQRIKMGRKPKDGDHAIVVFPFWKIPGVIGGWSITIRSQGRDEPLTMFRKSMFSDHKPSGSWETRESIGFAFLDRLPEVDPELGTGVSVFMDPLDALVVHDRSLQDSSKPLPVLALPSGTLIPPTFHGDLVAGRPVTILTRQIDTKSLTAVVDSRSQIAVYDERHLLLKIVQRTSARQALIRLNARAIPWHEALSNAIMERGVMEAHRLVSGMRLRDTQMEEILDSVSPDARDRLKACKVTKKVTPHSATGRAITEENGTWTCFVSARKSILISEGIVRIDEVRRFQKPRPHSMVRGRILFQDQVFPFEEDLSILERKGFVWMRDTLLDKHVGICNFSQHISDRSSMVTTALRFQKAVQFPGADELGWNRELNGFSLAKYLINRNGNLGPTSMSLVRLKDDGTEPTHKLRETPQTHPGDIREMSKLTSAPVWSVVLATLHEIVGPLLLWDPVEFQYGVAHHHHKKIYTFHRAACDLGCRGVIFPKGLDPDWPGIMGNKILTARKTDKHQTCVLNSWSKSQEDVGEFLRGIVIPFLSWWLTQNPGMLQLQPGMEHLANLLAQWFESLGGDPAPVHAGGKLWQ